MRVPSTMAGGHKFSQVPRATIERSQFDRSFGYKTTFDAGYLIPFLVDEVLPGDTFAVNTSAFARLATPLKPIMDNMTMETFFFFVPNRLVWTNWEKFTGEQDNPDDSTDFTVPLLTLPQNGPEVGSLWDYFGIPVDVAGGSFNVNALHSRAYNLIYNEWFRDQNIQDSVVVDKDDGADTVGDYVLLRRGKRHDYFTSCLPWPQKGDSVSLPLGTTAPLIVTGDGKPVFSGSYASGEDEAQLSSNAASFNVSWDQVGGVAAPDATTIPSWVDPKLVADLSGASAATINELRQSFQIQRLLERDARGGTRYTEIVRSHFGVTSPDARLQRPEYLGGGSAPVMVSPVAQTSVTAATPQGNLAAVGTVSFQGHGFTKSFTEHGVLIGLVSVRADLTYYQGLDRMWSRQTRYDYYWPVLSHIGEQAVLQQEIFLSGVDVEDEVVFGYQERYAEYRYKPSKVTGLFRPNVAGTLEVWHLAQEFAVAPTLDPAFIVEDPPVDRVIAVTTEPHFIFDSHTRMKCARPMPVYGVPGLIDHF